MTILGKQAGNAAASQPGAQAIDKVIELHAIFRSKPDLLVRARLCHHDPESREIESKPGSISSPQRGKPLDKSVRIASGSRSGHDVPTLMGFDRPIGPKQHKLEHRRHHLALQARASAVPPSAQWSQARPARVQSDRENSSLRYRAQPADVVKAARIRVQRRSSWRRRSRRTARR